MPRCTARNSGNGKMCKRNALDGHSLCAQHLAANIDVDTEVSVEVPMEIPVAVEVPVEVHVKPVKTVGDPVAELIARIEHLELQIATLSKKKKVTDPILVKAKYVFYHEHKKHPEVLAQSVQLYGEGRIHWRRIKKITDFAFDTMIDNATKSDFMTKAMAA